MPHPLPFRLFGFSLLLLSLISGRVKSQTITPVLEPYASQVETALELGYAYILSEQKEDGSFPGEFGGSAGVVALAGMSLLAAGHTPGEDEYGKFIHRCIDYVLAQQDEQGYIYADDRKDKGMYSHNISTKKTPVYNTAMIMLSLTVPYRQLPIYQRDETVDE